MTPYLLRRLWQIIPTMLGVILLVFFLFNWVGGDPAYWIEGAHGFAYRRRGAVDYEDQRIAGNTLLVERADGELVRVEGDLDRARAIEIAESVPG